MKLCAAFRSKERFLRFGAWDAAAAALLVGFAVYHIYLARIGFQNPDEAFYLTIPHRLLRGDSLVTDEWHLSQFSSFFQILPFWLFHRITGGTEGIILYSRYVFIAAQTLFGAFLYRELRSFKGASLVSLFFYLRLLPYFTMVLNYFTLGFMFAIYVGLRLFVNPAKTKPRQVFCGMVYAWLVLVEPLTVLLYPLYTVLVILKNRNRAKRQAQDAADVSVCRSGSFWLWATVGIAVCFVLFLIILFSRTTLRDVLQAIPRLAQDSEYPMDKGVWDVFTRFLKRDVRDYMQVLNANGHVWILFTVAACVAAAIAVSRFSRLDLRHAALLGASVLLIWTLCLTIRSWPDALYFPLDWQFAVYGLVCHLLTKNKRKDLFSFYVFGVLFALILNSSSECDVGVGMLVPAIVSPQLCSVFIRELGPVSSAPVRGAHHIGNIQMYRIRKCLSFSFRAVFDVRHKRYRLEKALVFICVCAVVCTQTLLIAHECRGDCYFDGGFFAADDVDFSTVIERGPYRGVKATAERARLYEDILSDLDRVRAETDEDDVIYIANLFEWCYLYLDVSVYSPYSAYFLLPDLEKRQFPYWEMHPEKTPDCIYLPAIEQMYDPNYSAEKENIKRTLQTLQDHFVCQTEETKCGYILHVSGLREM